MGSKRDLTGSVFGKWLVLEQTGKNKYGMAIWLCRCGCGKEKPVLQGSLVSGTSISCGCSPNKRKTIHGYLKNGSYPKEYSSWRNMLNRCYNVKHISYPNYGGKGVVVCDRWIHSFYNFIQDMGFMPSKEYSIDRINNDGNYEPLNCRWATVEEQHLNTKIAKPITYNGETKTRRGWDIVLGGRVVQSRIKAGWDEQKAVSTPIKKHNYV